MVALITGYCSEFFLYVLALGITFSNVAAEIGAGGTIGCFFIRYLFSKPKDILLAKEKGVVGIPALSIIACFLVYLVVLYISFLRSPYPHESLKVFLRILRFFVVYIALTDYFYGNSKRIIRFFWVLVAVAAITFFNGTYQHFFGYDLFRHYTINSLDYLKRVQSSFVHPNDFAAYIIWVLPVTGLFFLRSFSRKQQLILFCITLLGLFCLLRTSSRSGWIGFIVALFVFFWYYKRKFAMLAPLFLLVVILISPHGFDRASRLFSSEQGTVWERKQLWIGTWRMVKEHPVLGFGLNTYSKIFPRFKPIEYPDLRYTHNSYLQMWSEIGALGLMSFMAIIVSIIRKVTRGLRKKVRSGKDGVILLSLFCGFTAFLVQSAFDTNLFSLVLMIFFWAMTAYMVALNGHIERKISGT